MTTNSRGRCNHPHEDLIDLTNDDTFSNQESPDSPDEVKSDRNKPLEQKVSLIEFENLQKRISEIEGNVTSYAERNEQSCRGLVSEEAFSVAVQRVETLEKNYESLKSNFESFKETLEQRLQIIEKRSNGDKNSKPNDRLVDRVQNVPITSKGCQNGDSTKLNKIPQECQDENNGASTSGCGLRIKQLHELQAQLVAEKTAERSNNGSLPINRKRRWTDTETFPENRERTEKRKSLHDQPSAGTSNSTKHTEISHKAVNSPQVFRSEALSTNSSNSNKTLNTSTSVIRRADSINNNEMLNAIRAIKTEVPVLVPALQSMKEEVRLHRDNLGRIMLFVCSKAKKVSSTGNYLVVSAVYLSDEWHEEIVSKSEAADSKTAKKVGILKSITFGVGLVKKLYEGMTLASLRVLIVVDDNRQFVDMMRKHKAIYPNINLCDCQPYKCNHNPSRWICVERFTTVEDHYLPDMVLNMQGIKIDWCSPCNISRSYEDTIRTCTELATTKLDQAVLEQKQRHKLLQSSSRNL